MQGDGLVTITDESIERIPIIESDVLPERYWETLRSEQQELLRYVRDDELGTEAVAYYTMDITMLGRYKGLPGARQVFPTRYDVPHIVVHNHPDGRTLSINDFIPFIDNPMTKIMCAVGNNGTVYTLEKLPEFEAANAVRVFMDAHVNILDPKITLIEHIEYTETFYTSTVKYGFLYRKG